MDFFTLHDLEYYSSVRKQKFKKGAEFKEVGNTLKTEGPFGKTWHWAELIGKEGYPIEHSHHWQIAGKIRKYSWSKIFLPGHESTQVYFTVGVGSRLSNDVFSLEYKLDCHRVGISKIQEEVFDKHLHEQLGEYPWITIDKDKLDNYTWEKLQVETLDFIKKHKEYYKECVNLIWPDGVGSTPNEKQLQYGKYQFKEGHNPGRTGIATVRSYKKEYDKQLIHEDIKEKLYYRLANQYKNSEIKVGTEVQNGFGKLIDLVVSNPVKGDTFYEIKTGPSALSCIREALGQIIEYAYYPYHINAIKLVIVSPHALNALGQQYLKHLRSTLKIDLYYQQFISDSDICEEY